MDFIQGSAQQIHLEKVYPDATSIGKEKMGGANLDPVSEGGSKINVEHFKHYFLRG